MHLLRRFGMTELSIILVNYKVPYFLEQCLLSVEKATVGLSAEVIVVDNASGDGSIEYLSPRFPAVRFMEADLNLGFAKACNRGFQESRGRYILFLNPDTILSEDCLRSSIDFLADKPQAGALGIRMIDGSGKFLPESKRAFPHPATAFYKISGLAALFPSSPRFARYHLGHLSPLSDHEIDVVAGAYFLVRRSVLEQVGLFDEQFFMYGEDIDLSYRIQQAGYTNYYFSGATILHFKGESTNKHRFRYVKLFYGAMSLFVKKHRLPNKLFTVGIQLGIGLRAMMALLERGASRAKKKDLQFPVAVIGFETSLREIQSRYPEQPPGAFIRLEPDARESILTGRLNELNELIQINDLVFCSGDLSYRQIFLLMEQWRGRFPYRFYSSRAATILPLSRA